MSTPRVVVIDRDAAFLRVISTFLRSQGYAVKRQTETEGALDLILERGAIPILNTIPPFQAQLERTMQRSGLSAAEVQAIMAQQGRANTVEYFVNTTFNYPTMAEAYRVALWIWDPGTNLLAQNRSCSITNTAGYFFYTTIFSKNNFLYIT